MNQIKEIRAKTGLSQAKFADKYGMSRRAVEDWERGVRTPAPWIVALLERVVGEDFEGGAKMYFIADDNGTLYAHDIQSKAKAEAVLDDILSEHPEYAELNLEVLGED